MDMDIDETVCMQQQQQNTTELMNYDYESDADSIGEIEFDTNWEVDSDEEEQVDNLADLERLYAEATEMIAKNQPPTEGWYDDRYKYIYKYSHLNWDEMASKFLNKDQYIHDLCIQTKAHIQDILDGYSGTPNFDFRLYYIILTNILTLWRYYSNKYVGEETDTDIVDLVEALTFLTS